MGIANYVRNGRRFGDRKCSLGAKIPKMSLQAYDSCMSLWLGRPPAGWRWLAAGRRACALWQSVGDINFLNKWVTEGTLDTALQNPCSGQLRCTPTAAARSLLPWLSSVPLRTRFLQQHRPGTRGFFAGQHRTQPHLRRGITAAPP